MSSNNDRLNTFLRELMKRKRRLPSQLAADLGISHATVSRWLSGKDTPSVRSCRKLAAYTNVSPERIFSLAGHLPQSRNNAVREWPEFREYAEKKYPNELDDDMITMIEDLIERRKEKRGRNR